MIKELQQLDITQLGTTKELIHYLYYELKRESISDAAQMTNEQLINKLNASPIIASFGLKIQEYQKTIRDLEARLEVMQKYTANLGKDNKRLREDIRQRFRQKVIRAFD